MGGFHVEIIIAGGGQDQGLRVDDPYAPRLQVLRVLVHLEVVHLRGPYSEACCKKGLGLGFGVWSLGLKTVSCPPELYP